MQVDTRRLSDIGSCALRPMSQTDAKSVLSSLRDIAKSHPQIADLVASETPLKDFVVAALSLSPYLRDTVVSHPLVLVQALAGPLAPYLETCIQTARDAWKGADAGKSVPDAEIMTRLRQAKRDIAFAIALADLSRLFDARETTRWLSDFAGAAVSAAIDHLLLSADDSGKLNVVDAAQPSGKSGVVVLGMGKLGAYELNLFIGYRSGGVLRATRTVDYGS